MRIAQGGFRKKPDGFLHLNNYSHVKASGLAGVLYERVFTERQQEIVEKALIEIAKGEADCHFNDHHNAWRFNKEFLHVHFKGVVYGTLRLLKKSAAQMMSMAVVGEELEVKTAKVNFPKTEWA